MFLLLLLFLWRRVEKLSHQRPGIQVEFDGVLEHFLFRPQIQVVLLKLHDTLIIHLIACGSLIGDSLHGD